MLVYDNMPNKTRDWDGVTIESGLRASFHLNPLKITGWYYTGKLYDDYDWQSVLMNDFSDYRVAQGKSCLKMQTGSLLAWRSCRD